MMQLKWSQEGQDENLEGQKESLKEHKDVNIDLTGWDMDERKSP